MPVCEAHTPRKTQTRRDKLIQGKGKAGDKSLCWETNNFLVGPNALAEIEVPWSKLRPPSARRRFSQCIPACNEVYAFGRQADTPFPAPPLPTTRFSLCCVFAKPGCSARVEPPPTCDLRPSSWLCGFVSFCL